MGRVAVVLAVAVLGVAAGLFTLDIARREPATSFAGGSTLGAAALLAAGWTLIACGAAFWLRRPRSSSGPLLAAAGLAWFLLEWNNPVVGSPVAFTVGLCLSVACPPLAAHAVLAYPEGRLGSMLERGLVAIAYAGGVVLLGALPALAFDPASQGCAQCPANRVHVVDALDFSRDANTVGVYAGVAWATALAALALVKRARASAAARRARGFVLVGGSLYLALVAAVFAASLDRGFLTNETLERRLWLGQAVALCGVAVAVAWTWLRVYRARAAVARLVVDLSESPPPGGLRDALAGLVGDPSLALAYPLDAQDRLVDAGGRPAALAPEQERTTLVRDGRPVAVLAHRPGLLDDVQLVDEVTAAVRLALDHERLQAEVRARVEELRASRARIVDAGDAERRRLERDLHDGAQQRLVALSLSLALARGRVAAADEPRAAYLAEADAELRAAIADLRELAHGIFPAVLEDEGLAAAVEALAEDGRARIRVGALPEGRFPAPAESAAYTVVAEAARAARMPLTVRGDDLGTALVVEVELADVDGLDLVELEDRVGAVDGRLEIRRPAGDRVTIRAELPCGS